MNEEREEVKRRGQGVIEGIWKVSFLIFLVLTGVFVFQLIFAIRDCIDCIANNMLITKEEYTISSSFVAKIILKMRTDSWYQLRFEPSLVAMLISSVMPIMGVISLLSDHLFPMDCHYVIFGKDTEDYFSVSFPDAYELQTPLEIKRKFRMDVSKKAIKINDGHTILKLPYDKGAETLLWKIQKG